VKTPGGRSLRPTDRLFAWQAAGAHDEGCTPTGRSAGVSAAVLRARQGMI